MFSTGRKKGPYVEEDLPNPQNVYGKSKLLGETLIREHCPDHLILRTSWLFGPNGNNFIRTILDAARKGSSLRVVNDQKGSPTYAKDLAAHTLTMIHAGCRSTYHVTNSGSCTWFELASNAAGLGGNAELPVTPVPTSEFPRPRPAAIQFRSRQCPAAARWFPMRPWQAAAREYVEHIEVTLSQVRSGPQVACGVQEPRGFEADQLDCEATEAILILSPAPQI